MAELKVDATGHVLTFVEFGALSPASQAALKVGGGSADSNDYLLPFVLDVAVTKIPNSGNPQILTNLTKSNFTVFLATGPGVTMKTCSVVQFDKSGFSYRLVVGSPPPHKNLSGPWLLLLSVKPNQKPWGWDSVKIQG